MPGIALIPCIPVLNLQAALMSTTTMESVMAELDSTGIMNAPYGRVMFTFHPSFASQHLLAVGNWDESRRHSVRTILHEARLNFHRQPRPWWVHGWYGGRKNVLHT